MWRAVLCLFVSSCGPVMLGDEPGMSAGSSSEVVPTHDASVPMEPASVRDANVVPQVSVRIKSIDCGKCFDLEAQAWGGQPPYEFEWSDGTIRAQRTVCLANADLTLSVTARDATASRSEPQAVRLERAVDIDCPKPMVLPAPPVRPKLCLENLSFEGTPAANFGQDQAFDAPPWSACTNPMATNTPDVGNNTVAQTLGTIPEPTDGLTFLALGEGEQVSQPFCGPIPDDTPMSVELDLARLNIGAGIVPETEQVFLEVWGGLSVNCSRRELLWASPPLQTGWQHYCMTLRIRSFMTQLTLRTNSDMTLPTPAYLLVDNLKPVDGCP
jgi:hypothetical protein